MLIYPKKRSFLHADLQLRPDEIMRLPEHQSLILRSGYAPVKAGQFIWYRENLMKNLALSSLLIPGQCVQQTSFDKDIFSNE